MEKARQRQSISNEKQDIFMKNRSFSMKIAAGLMLFMIFTARASQQILTEPKPFSVISSNVVRLKPAVSDSVKEARFFASFWEPLTYTHPGLKQIGTEKKPPFVHYWDVSRLPDQDMWRIKLACVVEYLDGRVVSDTAAPVRFVVLDRNPAFSTKTALEKNSFLCGDDSVRFSVSWDKKEICVRLVVDDDAIFSDFHSSRFLGNKIWANDFAVIYLDPLHERSCFLGHATRAVQVSPNGEVLLFDPATLITYPDTAGLVRVEPKIRGTLNDNSDTDTSWSAVVHIPRTHLGPFKDDTLGMNICVGDRDGGDSAMLRADWINLGQLNAGNPSEWGNLVLVRNRFPLVPLFSGGALILAAAVFVARRRRAKRVEPEKAPHNPLVRMVAAYVRENRARENFSLDDTAAHFNLNKDYLGKLFKKEMGLAFSGYLNNVRIEEAKRLLRETPESVTTIAFEAGYESLDTFQKSFKRVTGMTPSQYRKNLSQTA